VPHNGQHPDVDDGSQAKTCFADGDGLDAFRARFIEGYSFAAQESVHLKDCERMALTRARQVCRPTGLTNILGEREIGCIDCCE
jgi:hypothetical protein